MLVLSRGAKIVVLGAVVGISVAAGLTRLMQSLGEGTLGLNRRESAGALLPIDNSGAQAAGCRVVAV